MSKTLSRRSAWQSTLVAVVLASHAGLLAWIGLRNAPNSNEASHLAAGVYNWHVGRFDPYPVNPPLMRMLAAMPVAWAGPVTDWKDYEKRAEQSVLGYRTEWSMGVGFIRPNREWAKWYIAWARWMLIPMSLLGGYVCWRWAGQLYGESAGVVALLLWCFSPTVLAWSATICPDAAAASLGVAAGYFFWHWLKRPDKFSALLAGIGLGLALLTKMTWLILFAAWPMVWLVWGRVTQLNHSGVSRMRQALQLASVLAIGLLVLNLGYAFEGTFTPLGKYTFASRALAGNDSILEGNEGGNRFAGTWLGHMPLPLPANFVRGIDIQKVDFENGLPSYLFGQWKERGWSYYYLVCAALKVPLSIWLLGLLAVGATIFGRYGLAHWSDEIALLLPAAILLALVSSQTGFSRNFRYVLPAFPLLFIWISKVAWYAERRPRTVGMLVTAAIAWLVASSLWVYPHSMSYFNEIAGGPRNGHRFLLHANVDWGQDAHLLRQWWERHPEVKPLHSLSRNTFGDDLLTANDEDGLGASLKTLTFGSIGEENEIEEFVPNPGWYAVSVHRIHDPKDHFGAFRRFQPVASIGYSIWLYHIALDEANRVRQEFGLAELTKDRVEDTAESLTARLADSVAAGEKRTTPVRVALFNDERAGDDPVRRLSDLLEQETSCTLQLVTPEDIHTGILNRFDVVIFPGGSGIAQAEALGKNGKRAVRAFIRNGGGYVGICAGAFLATAGHDWSLGLVNANALTGERGVPGHGTVDVKLIDTGKRIFGDGPRTLDMLYSGGPILSHARRSDLPRYVTLATFRTEVWRYEPQKGTMADTPAIIAGCFGKGHVILFSPHPETTEGLESLVRRAVMATAGCQHNAGTGT